MKNTAIRVLTLLLLTLGLVLSSTPFLSGHPQQLTQPEPATSFSIGDLPTAISDSLTVIKVADLPPDNNPTSSVQFINGREGWISTVGKPSRTSDGRTSVEGKLWRTRDAGKNWEFVYHNPFNSIDSFQFINQQTGWMAISGSMYKSEDGGNTWTKFRQPIPPLYDGDLCGFKFLDNGKQGWIVGGIYLPFIKGDGETDWPPSRYTSIKGKKGLRGVIFHTTDGGNTWQKQLVYPWYGYICGLYLVNADHGCAIGITGVYYLKRGMWRQTESEWVDDYGNYKVHSLATEIGAPTIEPVAIHFVNTNLGWMSNNNGYLAKSTDGGKTWKDIVNIRDISAKRDWPLLYFTELHFANAEHGLGLDSDGVLRESKDGGLSWAAVNLEIKFDNMHFYEPQKGFAVSSEGVFRLALDKQ